MHPAYFVKTTSGRGINFMLLSSVASPSFNKTISSLIETDDVPAFFPLSVIFRIFPLSPVKPPGTPPVKVIVPSSCTVGISGHNDKKELLVVTLDISKYSVGIWIVPPMAFIELLPVFKSRITDMLSPIWQDVLLLTKEIDAAGCTDADAKNGKADRIAVEKRMGIAFR